MTPEGTRLCSLCGELKPLEEFALNKYAPEGRRYACRECERARQKRYRKKIDMAVSAERDRAKLAEERARREASDFEALKPEDFSSGVADEVAKPGQRAKWARERRQEFNRSMGDFAGALQGGPFDAKKLGEYIARLSEEERRFGNRRLARSVSIAAAHSELARALFAQTAEKYFAKKITPTGYALKKPNPNLARTVVLLLSDLHFGANLDARGNPMPYRAIEEARRFEHVVRNALDFKPQYRAKARLLVLLNGDVVDGLLQHDQRAGLPLTEQKAAFWSYLSAAMALFAQQFPEVLVECQPGNHGRNVARHPGRATEDKWDGIEWDLYFALSKMCSGLKNVRFSIPFQAVSVVDLYGSKLGVTHGDTEVRLGDPDAAAERNAAALDRINSTRLYKTELDAWAIGHFHKPRYHPRSPRAIFNGALVPPNGHARTQGYIGEPCGQWLWEAVEGYPVGDLRFIEVGQAQDRDERLGELIKPFRFAE